IRSRLVTGDDHVACCIWEGWKRLRFVASIVDVADPPPFAFVLLYCSDHWRLILLRGVAWNVMRPIPFFSRESLNACFVLSKSTVQAFGLPAFLLTHMPGTEL